MNQTKKLVLNKFAYRQFDSDTGLRINMDKKEFMEKLNEIYLKNPDLKDGYAPFCKHIFVKNFTDCCNYYQEINDENEHLLKTRYEARQEYELAVLRRFFLEKDIKKQEADKKQIEYEVSQNEGKKQEEDENLENEDDYDWGVISIKAQNLDHEIPMDPITMMRNALGAEEGGSGEKLDREKYKESVDFWSKNAIIWRGQFIQF